MGITVDFTEVDRLLLDMRKTDEVVKESRKIVVKGAFQIQRDWRRRWSGHPHFPALPAAVTFDVEQAGSRVSAEIGPDKGRPAGPLGNIIEFGTTNNAPIPGGLPALNTERPKFEKAVADLGEKLLPA